MVTEKEIHSAFDVLDRCTTALETQVNADASERAEVEAAKAGLLASGVIDGKNAEIREGQIKTQLAHRYESLAISQQELARRRTALARAQIEVDRVKTLLRLMEVLKP
jgi:hypothetical protein